MVFDLKVVMVVFVMNREVSLALFNRYSSLDLQHYPVIRNIISLEHNY